MRGAAVWPRSGQSGGSTMSRKRRMTAVVSAVLVVGSIGAGGVMAASQSRDEAALAQVDRGDGGRNVERRIGAFESAAVGIKQIYSPMVDVSHEPRWGRISEAAGEDPYLNSVMAASRVTGAQGKDYSAPDKVVTSVKHFVAYGQPESGRDY